MKVSNQTVYTQAGSLSPPEGRNARRRDPFQFQNGIGPVHVFVKDSHVIGSDDEAFLERSILTAQGKADSIAKSPASALMTAAHSFQNERGALIQAFIYTIGGPLEAATAMLIADYQKGDQTTVCRLFRKRNEEVAAGAAAVAITPFRNLDAQRLSNQSGVTYTDAGSGMSFGGRCIIAPDSIAKDARFNLAWIALIEEFFQPSAPAAPAQ